MDKTGILAVVTGAFFCAIGVLALSVFLPEVIVVVRGLIGFVLILFGIMLVFFGILIAGD